MPGVSSPLLSNVPSTRRLLLHSNLQMLSASSAVPLHGALFPTQCLPQCTQQWRWDFKTPHKISKSYSYAVSQRTQSCVLSLSLPRASRARPHHGRSFWLQKPSSEFKYTTLTAFPLSLVAVISSNNSSKLLKHDLPCLNVCQVVLIKLCIPIYALHNTLRRGFQDFLILCIPLDHLSLNSNNDKQNGKDKNSLVST